MRLDWRLPIFLAAALSGVFGSTGFGDANAPFTTDDVVEAVPNSFNVPVTMELDSDDRPAILYFQDAAGPSPTTGAVRLHRCNDVNCDSGSDTEIASGLSRSIAIGLVLDGSGFPVIAYWVSGASQVQVIRCDNRDCTGSKTPHPVTGRWGSTGAIIDIELTGNLPAMVLNVPPNTALVRCLLPDCSTGATSNTLPTSGSLPQLEFTSGELPVITVQSFATNRGFEILSCDDPLCADEAEMSATLETDTSLGYNASLILDALDRPRIAYGNNMNSLLKLAMCADSACSGSTIFRTVTTGTTLGHTGNGIALHAGNVVVAYQKNTANQQGVKLVRCADATCTTFDTSDVDGPASGTFGYSLKPSLAFRENNGYFVAYYYRTGTSVRLHRASPAAFETTPGDVDCNGTWTSQDALIIMRQLAGLTGAPLPVAPCSTDVDGTPGTSLSDVIFARRKAAGL